MRQRFDTPADETSALIRQSQINGGSDFVEGVGESFDHLLSRPESRGRFGDIEMQDFATLMGQDQKDIQHAEGGGRYGKEIHCDQCLGMVLKEGLPSLNGGRRSMFGADLFCFPTYYENENQPVNLIEAMAFRLDLTMMPSPSGSSVTASVS